MSNHPQQHAIIDDLRDRIQTGEAHLQSLRLIKPELYDAAHLTHLTTVANILRTIATISPKAAVTTYDTLAPVSKPASSQFAAAIAHKLTYREKRDATQLALAFVAAEHLRSL